MKSIGLLSLSLVASFLSLSVAQAKDNPAQSYMGVYVIDSNDCWTAINPNPNKAPRYKVVIFQAGSRRPSLKVAGALNETFNLASDSSTTGYLTDEGVSGGGNSVTANRHQLADSKGEVGLALWFIPFYDGELKALRVADHQNNLEITTTSGLKCPLKLADKSLEAIAQEIKALSFDDSSFKEYLTSEINNPGVSTERRTSAQNALQILN